MAPSVPLTCTGHTAALCPMLGPLWAACPIPAWETCRNLTPVRWLPLCHTWPRCSLVGSDTQACGQDIPDPWRNQGPWEWWLCGGSALPTCAASPVLTSSGRIWQTLVLQCLVVLLRARANSKVFQKCVINLCLGRKTSSVLSYSWENDREKTNTVKMEDSVAERTQVDSLLCSLLTDSSPHQSLRASLISSCSTTL